MSTDISYMYFIQTLVTACLVCWSLTSLCHSNGHIETIPTQKINPFTALTRFDFIECFTTTFLRAHSWLNWVDEDDDEHDEVGLKEKPEDTRYIKKITSK